MPIDSHVDFFKLAQEESSVGGLFKKIANQERHISDVRDKLAQELDNLIRIKTDGARLLKELAKMIDELNMTKGDSTGVDKTKLDAADAKVYTSEAAILEREANTATALSDALKTLSFQVKNLVEKLAALGTGYENVGNARKNFTKADQTLFERKDKLSDKLNKFEDTKAEAARAFDQAKQDISRRKDEYIKELEKFKTMLTDVGAKTKI